MNVSFNSDEREGFNFPHSVFRVYSNVTSTRTGKAAIWESGGFNTNEGSGYASIVSSPKGGIMSPVYLVKEEERQENGHHALFIINTGMYIVESQVSQSMYEGCPQTKILVTVNRVVALHRIRGVNHTAEVYEEGRLYTTFFDSVVNLTDSSKDSTKTLYEEENNRKKHYPRFLNAAVTAAVFKACTPNCTSIFFTNEKRYSERMDEK